VIVLEITDESGVTHYQLLELDPAEIARLDDRAAGRKVSDASRVLKHRYNRAAQRGDATAEQELMRIGLAETILKNEVKRKEYDDSLGAGAGDQAAIFRAQQIGVFFFWERAIRFRVVERLMPVMPDEG
jgi:hypothetical protein